MLVVVLDVELVVVAEVLVVDGGVGHPVSPVARTTRHAVALSCFSVPPAAPPSRTQ